MSVTIRQHIPTFVDTDEPRKQTILETADDIPNDPWLKTWMRDDPWARREKDGTVTRGVFKFYRFSQSTEHGATPTLMAEYDNGDRWWVIGYMSAPLDGLPEWRMTEAGKARVEKWNRGELED
jgi:hypothetical protein